MTEQHPITPSPELVQQWRDLPEYTDGRRKMVMVTLSREKLLDIATQAARWGSDQELEACCEHLKRIWSPSDTIDSLRAARAVLKAACIHHGLFNEEIIQRRRMIAAALRAAALYSHCPVDRRILMTIAAELEGAHDDLG